ncbi:MAG TPA: hypothetical protein VK539_39145 [Myxococcaceae bacterium]|nr:hypothetical protein [Myxococcaceae bacterium]
MKAQTPGTKRSATATTWTLVLDESGQFEGRLINNGSESLGWVVGGVLLPGNAKQTEGDLQQLRQWWEQAQDRRWPPHANELPVETVRTALLNEAAQVVERLGGMWLFVVAPTSDRSAGVADLGLFVRMFGATVDLASRLVASLGGSTLDARPASRSIPLAPELAARAESLGVGLDVHREGFVHSMLSAEVRHAIEALAREPVGGLPPWPRLESVRAEPATKAASHPGLALADVGCNFIRRQLKAHAGGTFSELVGPLGRGALTPMVVPFAALERLRELDRALRDRPPQLITAGRRLASLEGDAHGAGTGLSGLHAGAVHCGRLLWERAVSALATAPLATGFARSLAAGADVELAARTGAYEGTWMALSEGWAGEGALATATRSACDRRLAARLWRLTLECANHRGDVTAASRAVTEFEALLARGRSQALLAEELEVRNLGVVTVQNRLPCPQEQIAELSAELDRQSSALAAAADRAALAGEATAPAAVEKLDADELALWRAVTGREPAWAVPDRERGMAYGTVARSLAFLGRLEEALKMALRAREHFADSPFDRRINAATIARIQLERARCGALPATEGKARDAALALCGARALCDPQRVATFDAATDPGLRFALDIALRALLWAPPAGTSPAEVARRLGSAELRAKFSRGELRSHPTELIARHAAELLRRYNGPADAIEGWFALSMELCEQPAAGHTQRQFRAFTHRLAAEPGFVSDGAPGSVLNPTFEYR